MTTTFLVIGLVFTALAALVHVFIFSLESALWLRPSTWKRFGLTSQADAETTRSLAFNQGFYNLFLAAGALVGLVFVAQGSLRAVGLGIDFFALGSMLAAAIVLIVTSPHLARAAITQGAFPLLGIIFLALGSATH